MKKNSGQVLIESMVALTIAVVGLLGILALLSQSLSLNRVVSQQLIGNYLAAEGLEIVKNIIDSNVIASRPWNDGFSSGDFEADYQSLSLESNQNRPLRFDSANLFYSYGTGGPSPFVRTVTIEFISPDEMKVNSVVRWTTRGRGMFEVNLEDHFFNWRP